MRPEALLGAEFECECGRIHRLDLQRLVYSESAVQELPSLLATFAGKGSIAVIADVRTHAVAGEGLIRELIRAGYDARSCIVADRAGARPECNETTRDALAAQIDNQASCLVAVGSGVITDLCKWLATDLGIPYVVVATAASMNGYASANIAPTIRGVKSIVRGVVPRVICAVPSVLKAAPYELTAAGLGDVIAKPVSVTDWQINRLIFGEYCCDFCCQLIRDFEPCYLARPEALRECEDDAIRALFLALVYSGVAMTLADTSFPASGGEHLISHVLDMTAELHGTDHDYHGRQVGIGTIFACALYDRLVKLESPQFRAVGGATDRAYWGRLSDAVEEEHARKRVRAALAVKRLAEPGIWDRVRALIAANYRPARTIKECLQRAAAAHTLAHIGCSRERFLASVAHAHEIRERYTVIDLACTAGILPDVAAEIVDEYLTD